MAARCSITLVGFILILAGCGGGEEASPAPVSSTPSAVSSSHVATPPSAQQTIVPSGVPGSVTPQQPGLMQEARRDTVISVAELLASPPEGRRPEVRVRGTVRSINLNQFNFSERQKRVVILYGPHSEFGGGSFDDVECELSEVPSEPIGCGSEVVIEGTYEDSFGGPKINSARISDILANDDTLPAVPTANDFAAALAEVVALEAHIKEVQFPSLGTMQMPFHIEETNDTYVIRANSNASGSDIDAFRQVIDQIKENPLISQAELDGHITTEGLELIASIRGLQSLKLYSNLELDTVDLTVLAALPHLRDLSLYDCEPMGDVQCRQLAELHQVYELNLGEFNVSRLYVPTISEVGFAALGSLQGLRHLRIVAEPGFVAVSDVGLTHLGRLVNLRSLRLGADGIDGSGFAAWAGCQSLEYVEINTPMVTAQIIEGLTAIPNLKGLNLSRRNVDPAIAGSISSLASLEMLSLEDVRMEMDDEFLQALGQLPMLSYLNLNQVPIGDEQLALILAGGCPNLQVLNLSNTEITNDGLNQLIATPPPKLRSLWLYSTAIAAESASRLGTVSTLRELHVDFSLKDAIRAQVEADNPEVDL